MTSKRRVRQITAEAVTLPPTEWFTKDLPDTWSKPKEAMFMCLENCGTCRDRPERIQEQLYA